MTHGLHLVLHDYIYSTRKKQIIIFYKIETL